MPGPAWVSSRCGAPAFVRDGGGGGWGGASSESPQPEHSKTSRSWGSGGLGVVFLCLSPSQGFGVYFRKRFRSAQGPGLRHHDPLLGSTGFWPSCVSFFFPCKAQSREPPVFAFNPDLNWGLGHLAKAHTQCPPLPGWRRIVARCCGLPDLRPRRRSG